MFEATSFLGIIELLLNLTSSDIQLITIFPGDT